jgi:hypothetical protein
VVPPRTPATKLVIETRPKRYPVRPAAFPGYKTMEELRRGPDGRPRFVYIKRRSNKRGDRIADPGGVGHEIVRELTVCPDCARSRQSW